jgi:hypothetical protein
MRGSLVSFRRIIVLQQLKSILEELLIDFQELIGQHSGENMASVVWSTLVTYNIRDKVCADFILFYSN